jgi:hypothetical protein
MLIYNSFSTKSVSNKARTSSKYNIRKEKQRYLISSSNQFAATAPITAANATTNFLCHHEGDDDNNNDALLFDKKIALATEGLIPFFEKMLREKMLKENALIISEYIIAARRDSNISNGYRKANIQILTELSQFFHSSTIKKNFKEMTTEDVLQYLDSLR